MASSSNSKQFRLILHHFSHFPFFLRKEKDQEEHRTGEVVDEEAVRSKLLNEDDEPGS